MEDVNMYRRINATHAFHSFEEEEVHAICRHLNTLLEGDELCKHLLPMNLDARELCLKVRDGLLLAAWVEKIKPGAVDVSRLHRAQEGRFMSRFKMVENQQMALDGCKKIGSVIVNVGPQDLMAGAGAMHLILGVMWQLLEVELSIKLDKLRSIPEAHEDSQAMSVTEQKQKKLSGQADRVLQWANNHLKNAGKSPICNLTSDIQDSEAYLTILNQMDSKTCSMKYMASRKLRKRAIGVLRNAHRLGVFPFIDADDIVSGNRRLNLAFMTTLMLADTHDRSSSVRSNEHLREVNSSDDLQEPGVSPVSASDSDAVAGEATGSTKDEAMAGNEGMMDSSLRSIEENQTPKAPSVNMNSVETQFNPSVADIGTQAGTTMDMKTSECQTDPMQPQHIDLELSMHVGPKGKVTHVSTSTMN